MNAQVDPEARVLFRAAVTVTHVPGGPRFGRSVILSTFTVAAWTSVGPVTEYMETNRANVNNTSRKVELTVRVGNLTHALLIS